MEATFTFKGSNEDFVYINDYAVCRGVYSGTKRLYIFYGWPPQVYVNNNGLPSGTYKIRYENGVMSFISGDTTLISYNIGVNDSPTLKLIFSSNVAYIKDVKIKPLYGLTS